MVTPSRAAATVDSLNDDDIEEILLRLPSPASLARAALASSRWRRIASSPPFLRRYRERRPSSPVLGLFVSRACDRGLLPVFLPAPSALSDPDLAALARGGDFPLTRLQLYCPARRLRDFRDGRLLLCKGDTLSVYDPVSRRHVSVRRPSPQESPVPGTTEYMADCLLGGHGEDVVAPAGCIRVVTVQRDGERIRAMEYHSCAPEWRFHPWVDGIINAYELESQRAMHAAAAGLIFWRCDRNSSLLLDTSTMSFSMVPLPVPLVVLSTQTHRSAPVYAIGETEAGACCLAFIIGRAMLQVWLLKNKEDGGGNAWELEKQGQIGELADNRRFSVQMVVAGLALVHCVGSKYFHFVVDLKNLDVKDKFLCHRSFAYPYQMPWPPAGLLATSTCERFTPQACNYGEGAEKQQEAPSSSRKRNSNNDMSSGEETMEPFISMASLEDESSEKKFCHDL